MNSTHSNTVVHGGSPRLIVIDVNYPSIVPGISMLFLLAGNPGSFFKNGSLSGPLLQLIHKFV